MKDGEDIYMRERELIKQLQLERNSLPCFWVDFFILLLRNTAAFECEHALSNQVSGDQWRYKNTCKCRVCKSNPFWIGPCLYNLQFSARVLDTHRVIQSTHLLTLRSMESEEGSSGWFYYSLPARVLAGCSRGLPSPISRHLLLFVG